MRNSPFASQLPYKERKRLLPSVRLHSVFSRRDGHVRSFDVLRSIPRSTPYTAPVHGVCRGPYSKTLNVFKGIKLGQQDKDKVFLFGSSSTRSFSAPRSGICPYGGQVQRVQTNPGSWDGLNCPPFHRYRELAANMYAWDEEDY